MGNVVRYIFGDDSNPSILSGGIRPQFKEGNKSRPYSQEDRNSVSVNNPTFDPQRSKFLQIIDPELRQLRACKLSPKDRENAERALLELCVYWGEKILAN